MAFPGIHRQPPVHCTQPLRWPTVARVTLLAVLAVTVLTGCSAQQRPAPVEPWPSPQAALPTTEPATPTGDARTQDPLVPTLPAATDTPSLVATAAITATATVTPDGGLPQPAATVAPAPVEPGSLSSRLGVGVPRRVTDFDFDAAMAQQLGMGWYLDWRIDPAPVDVDGLEYAQLYSLRGGNIPLRRDRIAEVLAANPGALWLAGNEPDVIWQDNKTPEEYAQLYHELYTFVKTLDPSAQVAIAGVSQVTPLRLQYLEAVLAAYEQLYGQPMPVDVWNVHAFIQREERGSWGVSIPPGFDVDQGMLWEIEDHDNLDLFRQQIVDFRRWMARQGQRDKPLIISEFGILMPSDYGFPPEQVAQFMVEAFDYLLTATDPDIGYPADGNRLVQRLTWYSLSDTVYPTSNLVDPQTGAFTLLGQTFADYAAGLKESP